jgi:lipopolysaccharide biosynthesis protein/FMN phosphatase YigB (HAD superfamily)
MAGSSEISSLLTADLDPVLWTPELLDRPSAWWGHVPFAFWLVTALQPRTLVELGTHQGVSYAAFCEAVVRAKLETRCSAVDTWVGDPQAGFYGEEVYAGLKAFHDQRYAAFSELLRQNFGDAAAYFQDGSIDLLHIDGYHTYAAVRHDFETWRAKLSTRAVVLFHDTNVRRDDFGVWKFFAELKAQFPAFEFLHAYGLGVVAVGAEAPEAAKALCALVEAPAARFRHIFSHLGARWMEMSDREREMYGERHALSAALAEREAMISEILARLQKSEQALAETKRELENSEKTLKYVTDRATALINAVDEKPMTPWRFLFKSRADNDSHSDLALIRNSLLFDPDFYLEKNLDVSESGVDPAEHYLRYGAFEGRDPGPIFSTQEYLRRNPDVAAAKVNALLHYELHGRAEGRWPNYGPGKTVVSLRRPQRIGSLGKSIATFLFGKRNWDSKGEPQSARLSDKVIELPFSYALEKFYPIPRVAVLLHAYYTDDLPAFQQALRNISFPFALFISTDSEEKKKLIEQVFCYWQNGSVDVRVFPNLGRDIAPKFVGFREVHDAYEYVLHLHTKRSPHLAGLSNWRSFLLDCLLGSPEIVASIFEMFKHGPDLGIVAPRNFAPIINFMTWGVNFEKCAALAERMGIKLEPDSPLDFAAGSMFWARSQALKPLLDLGLTFDDFPNEEGQRDGEIGHAIERLTFYSCERAGYRWCHVGPAKAPAPFEEFTRVSKPTDLHEYYERGGAQAPLVFEQKQKKSLRSDDVIEEQEIKHGVNIAGKGEYAAERRPPLWRAPRWRIGTWSPKHFLFRSARRRLFHEMNKKPIAVVVHAFYPDVFVNICRLLKNIREDFVLFVAVQSDDDKERIFECTQNIGINASVDCRVVPNRGRNFSTLFVQFGAEISEFEIILHIHTKKSLYTGKDQTEWREALFAGLIGSSRLVESILRAFREDPHLGLFYPAATNMPYWAYHWLSNVPLGSQMLKRLNVERDEDYGYVDYPVGGMFWARTDAIRPLLQAGLTYHDFPVESGQTDGELQHAIERLIGVVTKEQGFSFVEHDNKNYAFKRNLGRKNLSQYGTRSISEFALLLQSVDIVSFDIFDTILTRKSLRPDSVLRYVGHKLARKYPGADDFFSRRKKAELLARKKKNHGRDVDLEEIYASFERDANWVPERINEAASLERRMDSDSICLRENMSDLLVASRDAGKRIIAVSDTYYTREDIERLLGKEGVLRFFDALYLSSAEGARKDRGDLWDKVIAGEGIPRDRWLHVGDNEQSDIQAACDRKLRFFHVMSAPHILEFDGFRPSAEPGDRRWASDLVLGPAALRLGGSPFLNGRSWGKQTLDRPEDVGYVVLGPIVFAFLSWIIRHPALRDLQHLYFLAREGYLLHNLYSWIGEKYPELELPGASYFYCSRRCSLAALQAPKFSPERIVSGTDFQGTLGDLLRNRIGFDVEDAALANRFIKLPKDRDEVIANIEKLRSPIIRHAESEYNDFEAYAKKAGMTAGKRLGVVDIGYSASIQKNLQDVLGIQLQGFYMATFNTVRTVRADGGDAFGCFAADVPPEFSEHPVLKYSLMMEAFLSAPHAQVLRFREEGLEPEFKTEARPREDLLSLSKIHNGATRYMKDLLGTYGPDLLFASAELPSVQEPLRMLMEGNIAIASALKRYFKVEDEYCGNGGINAWPSNFR